MSIYHLQKLIREINRNEGVRCRFMSEPEKLVREWKLEQQEAQALIKRDYAALYRLGVHGLLLRPFSIIHDVPEPDYLAMINQEAL
ncbi:MAG: hypothetical protein MI755_20735 [Sphingomonadales bacterium]|nr:hypothetical protein [Sphingomonadales bacterium]